MQSLDEAWVLRPRVLSHTELAAASEVERVQQAVMNIHQMEFEEAQGRHFTQRGVAASLAPKQPSAAPRGVSSVELADTMGAEGTSVEVESALRAAVSPEPTLEAVASPILAHTLRRGQGFPVVTPEGTAKRPRGRKWLCRRPTVRLRKGGPAKQPWMRVHDVEYGWLSKEAAVWDQPLCTVVRSVLRQLQWDDANAVVGAVVSLQLCMGDDVRTLEATVAAESLPLDDTDPWESILILRMALAMALAAVTEEYVEMGEGA